MKFSMGLAAVSAAALIASAAPAWADYIYGPDPTDATTEGDSNNIVFDHSDSHTQWVFAPTVFGSAPETINGFSLRFDSIVTNFYGNSGFFDLGPSFAVKLGTISGLASTTFSANLGNAVTVLSGAQSVPYTIGGPAGALKPWGVTLNFSTPYTYDPAAGSLLVDLFVPGQDMYGTMDFVADYFAAPTPSTPGYRVFNLDASSTMGRLQVFTPVIRFDTTPVASAAVPEPSAWALMMVGFAGLGTLVRSRRRRRGVLTAE